jgi:hypothetical protein
MAQRRKLMVDIDGCVANFWEGVIGYFGPPDVMGAYSLEEAYPMISQDKLDYWLGLPTTYSKLRPVEGARKGISRLVEAGWDAHYVTARPSHLYIDTLGWLEEYGFLPKYTDDSSYGRNLAHVIHNGSKLITFKVHGGFAAVVEDNLSNAQELAEVCELVFLYDWPYNSGPTRGAIRVANWDEIVERLLREE